MSDEDRVSMVPSLKTKTETQGFQDEDQDQDSGVQDGSQDVLKPRLKSRELQVCYKV